MSSPAAATAVVPQPRPVRRGRSSYGVASAGTRIYEGSVLSQVAQSLEGPILNLLADPAGDPRPLAADGERITNGAGATVAVLRDGVIDFVSPDRDDRGELAGFGYQWQKVVSEPLAEAQTYGKQLEQIRRDLLTYLDVSADQLQGKRALDVGCGHGLYVRSLASYGADVVGADLSEAVYLCAAQHGRAKEPGAQTFVRADVLRMPFKERAFDVVLCLGMAHHTPDPRAAVTNAIARVAPGGRFLLYIYEKGAVGYITLREKFPLPHRLPRPVLHAYCWAIAPAVASYLALRDKRALTWQSVKNTCLGLFDAYSPTYSYTYAPDEITQWMRDAGLTNVARIERCMYRGVRPQA